MRDQDLLYITDRNIASFQLNRSKVSFNLLSMLKLLYFYRCMRASNKTPALAQQWAVLE